MNREQSEREYRKWLQDNAAVGVMINSITLSCYPPITDSAEAYKDGKLISQWKRAA